MVGGSWRGGDRHHAMIIKQHQCGKKPGITSMHALLCNVCFSVFACACIGTFAEALQLNIY